MSDLQKSTNPITPTPELVRNNSGHIIDDRLKLLQQNWIDYCAVGGMITEADGEIKRITISDFAAKLNVHRDTLYHWQKSIPDFWEKVQARRHQIGSQARTAKVWNGVYLRAAKGDAEQAKIWLSQFANWQPPSQKHEVSIGGLGDLVNEARKKKIIEAESVEPDDRNNA